MSDIKKIKRKTKQNVKYLRDILTGMDIMLDGNNENNIVVAYTFTEFLIREVQTGDLSPKAIQDFLNKGE
jgi:hypothetical protein